MHRERSKLPKVFRGKQVAIIQTAAVEASSRSVFINAAAEQLFDQSAKQLTQLFNRQDRYHALTPFWLWLIWETDWRRVLAQCADTVFHSEMHLLQPETPSTGQAASGVAVQCVTRVGSLVSCRLLVCSSTVGNHRHLTFYFVPIS